MGKKIVAIIAALALLLGCATAETAWEGEFNSGQFDDGYDGSWIQVDALGIEFCLPEGWSETGAPSDAAFAAKRDAGGASVCIRPVAQNVDSLSTWGKDNLKDAQPDEANFYDVLVSERETAVSVYLNLSNGGVLSFDFSRDGHSDLPRSFALQIVGSVCELWNDEDIPMLEGDDGFDFGEAFEADLG